MTLAVRTAPFLAGGPLYESYITSFAAGQPDAPLRGLFDHPPTVAGASARAEKLATDYRGDRQALAASLVGYNRRIGAPAPALAAAGRLAEPGALAVVAGQQAGLLTGPAYAIYKAAGAIALARRLAVELERPVVPVFWAATEDHDLAEADHAWVLNSAETWQRLRFQPSSPAEGLSVGAVSLAGRSREAVLSDLGASLPAGRVAAGVLEMAAATGREAGTLGEWFCRLLAAIFGPQGLVILDPMEPALRRLAAPGVVAALTNQAALASALAQGLASVGQLGFAPQLDPGTSDAHVFFYPEGPGGPRRALIRTAAGFGLRDAVGDQWAPSQLCELAAADPERFSGSVVTRPLFQDHMLPTVAYMAGPGEIAYYAALGGCYRTVGLTMPVIWPRPSYTVVEPAVAHMLRKQGLVEPDLPAALEAAEEAAVRAHDELSVERTFDELDVRIDEAYGPVLAAAGRVDEVLGKLAEQNRRRVRRETRWLRRKAWQVARQRAATARAQLGRVRTHLWPNDGPQERTACGLYFLARLGLGFAADLTEVAPEPPLGHHYLYVG